MLVNVQTRRSSLASRGVAKCSEISTNEYENCAHLPAWGYKHETICHVAGAYARDADGDGFHGIHANTMEGYWAVERWWFEPQCSGQREFSQPCWRAFRRIGLCPPGRSKVSALTSFLRNSAGRRHTSFYPRRRAAPARDWLCSTHHDRRVLCHSLAV
jgi:hypothetical protein